MTLTLLKNVNFGRNRPDMTGSSGVTYHVLDSGGTSVFGPSTSGVYQTAPGIYAASISFADNFNGQLLWTCPVSGSFSAAYATEDQNVSNSDTRVDDILTAVAGVNVKLQELYDMNYGRWRIINNQMIFYKEDNVTEVARYNLFNDLGVPSMDSVFDRVKV